MTVSAAGAPPAETPQKLYVLGHPIAHSKSPVMYNAAYERLGLPWHYGAMDLPDALDARAFLKKRDFLSVNITTPYKPLAFELATARAASARLAHGANVLVRKGDALIGYNTDGQGCVANLERAGFDFAGKRVAVCGTGPTSLAILHAAAQAGADEALLLGRDKDRAAEVLRAYVDEYGLLARATIDLPAASEGHLSFREAFDHVCFKYGSYATSTQAIAAADLIIDATPLGMAEGDPAPFDTALLHGGQWVFDAVYGHGETALVAAARAAGATALDGAGMLVAQAVVTVQIVCDIAEAPQPLGFDELFALMAEAAGFDC
ncbi:shikimate dehydrogenase [Enterorhabdus sp. P55]|uniref:shikimate dehydrogenase family protein n=1 Tax=Enterorhabdus sp. P55 TaxID=2304571 RepID=UPI0013694D86|nr:shikimate dehydrogenase [Enterorhabdus sp. P55]NBI32066.1 shikimate dehydrogenase [Enterorhabdus sp. P55]